MTSGASPGPVDRWTYQADHRRRPHVHPLATPSGRVLSRDAPESHPWHHGLWFAIKFVNGDNFWEEYDRYGVVRHVDGHTLHWTAPDRETVVIVEQRTIVEVPVADDAYALDWSLDLTPTRDVVLDRTPYTTWGGYGGLALRGRADWAATRFLLDDGVRRERLLGTRSRWCDLSGTVDGGDAGVAILDDPANPRHPVPWYGATRHDNYGPGWSNFVNAAFLWEEPLAWPAGQPLRFRYRVVVHDGAWDAGRAEAEWQRWQHRS